jgi:curved DNA-binding protein CbpA
LGLLFLDNLEKLALATKKYSTQIKKQIKKQLKQKMKKKETKSKMKKVENKIKTKSAIKSDLDIAKINLYDILEVSPRARSEVIEAAYNTLLSEYSNSVDEEVNEERIIEILNTAKSVLLDDDKRAEYDQNRNTLLGKIVGEYKVTELIAEGGFGKTYKGEHIHLNTPICIKHGHFVSPQDTEILFEEAKAMWDLRHFGIPAVKDVMKLEDGSPALIMSYIPGPTLEQIVKKTKKLDPEHVAWIAERTLNILKYLHFHGVVHGDVKPQNVIVQPEKHTVVLVDYGLSMINPQNSSKNKGYTPFFAPPEQKRSQPLLPESDFYSLGMTMIYALGGDVKSKRVPDCVPDPICKFIRRLLVYDVLSRPNWEKEDLCETIKQVRQDSFGRIYSELKSIDGF